MAMSTYIQSQAPTKNHLRPDSCTVRVVHRVTPQAYRFLVKCDPIVRLSLPDTTCTTLDWANSELIAVGCANGEGAARVP
jgi:hypothetical protein